MISFPRALGRWYLENRRGLPWRKNQDPYRVWVSEIMLQQTQVDTVVPYYNRFLKLFPTLRSLAQAREDQVLALWSGLGYYGRARNLLKTAKIIAGGSSGRFPDTLHALQDLPGIGPYTAGAIASIAFEAPAAIYDGNVRRVLSRILLSRSDKELKDAAQVWVDKAHKKKIRPSVFNQALMELGALVCTPRNPSCEACPVQVHCGARKHHSQHLYPERERSRAQIQKFYSLAILAAPSREGRFLVVRRPPQDRWLKNLWEFPMIPSPASGDEPSSSLSREFGDRLGTPVKIENSLGEIRHSITHHDLRISVFGGSASKTPAGGRWVSREGLKRLSSSSILAKSLMLLPCG